MQPIKVSLVSYLNTLPFQYGIQNTPSLQGQIELSLDIPSLGATKLLTNQVDLALVPVAIIPQIPQAQIVSEYCIGANGPVETVLLLSDSPLHQMETILLDYQSRTSVQLVQLLARDHWKIAPKWQPATPGFEANIGHQQGGVIIGDRTFRLPRQYKHSYDLAHHWKLHTGLPFVFAAWVSNKPLPQQFIHDFNAALSYGLHHIPQLLSTYTPPTGISPATLQRYLQHDIQYQLDSPKRKALHLFTQWIKDNPS